jgi:pimeloyl-ACP methyl ester carboxylesterase
MRPVVIVHGAWHQPAHYRMLAEQLRERGAEVVIPDIGLRLLTDRTAIVQAAVDAQAEPPVVVAHSYGGASGGAVRGAAHIVFLAAWVLDVGETGGGWLEQFAGARSSADVEAAMQVSGDGLTSSIDPDHAAELFYADCSPSVAAHAVTLLRPDLLANFAASPDHAAWHDTPTSYVVATGDRTWPTGLDRLFAARCSRQRFLPTSHSPFLSRPEEMAAQVQELL